MLQLCYSSATIMIQGMLAVESLGFSNIEPGINLNMNAKIRNKTLAASLLHALSMIVDH